MSRWSAIFVAVLIVGLYLPALSVAQDYPSLDETPPVERTGEGDVAVIVAVEDYAFLPDVEGAIANGNDWEIFFERALGVSTIHFLADRNATNTEMRRFAETAVEDVDEGATVWFVFIGHGAPAEGGEDGILVGMDARQNPASLESRGIRQQELMGILEEGPQAETVAVVDACFSGRDTDGEALVEAQPVVPSDVEPDIEETSTVVMSAAQAEEFAGPLPGADRPAFSYLLLGALRGWADDGTGSVTADSALNYTRRVLRGIPGRFQQTPDLHGDNELVLARGVEESDPGIGDALRRGIEQEQAPEEELREEEPVEDDIVEFDPEDIDCPDGMEATVETQGECCWPGQVWSESRNECIGRPEECPEGYVVDADDQTCELPTCEHGKERVDGTTECCWPGQDWDETREVCTGSPDECPDDFVVDSVAETCAEAPSCSHGKERVEGTTECCWPGQDWSERNFSCSGEPSRCPGDRWKEGTACVETPPFSGTTLAVQSLVSGVFSHVAWRVSGTRRINYPGLFATTVGSSILTSATGSVMGQRSWKRGTILGGVVLGFPAGLGLSVVVARTFREKEQSFSAEEPDSGVRRANVMWTLVTTGTTLGGHYIHRKISSSRSADLAVSPVYDSANDSVGVVLGWEGRF